jgi:hypothetical protein
MNCHAETQDISLSVAKISEASQELKCAPLNVFLNITIIQGVTIQRLCVWGRDERDTRIGHDVKLVHVPCA